MYDVVSATRLLYPVAFRPRSGKAMNVLPPAQARPEPIPPSRFPATPFSSRPAVAVDRSGMSGARLPIAISTGAEWTVDALNAQLTTAQRSSFLDIISPQDMLSR